jgi:hypothetical protein
VGFDCPPREGASGFARSHAADGAPKVREIGMIIEAKERATKGQRSYEAYEDRVKHGSGKGEPEPAGFNR